MNLNFTFLTKQQVAGDKKLKIFEEQGREALITDFAILLGGEICRISSSTDKLENIFGRYWTKTPWDKENNNIICIIGDKDDFVFTPVSSRNYGARPSLKYASISSLSSNKKILKDGILEVEYGEYPQKVASKILQDKLESAYNDNLFFIRKTGKTYTTDSEKAGNHWGGFDPQIIDEYSFIDGKKYVRVKANFYYKEIILSNGERYKNGDYVWVEVEPIKWLIDEKKDIAISERILFAGVQFNHEKKYKGDFKNTTIKKFMDECFSKEIIVNSNEINICKKEEVVLNTTKNQTEIVNQNMSIDDIINETLFKMNEILGEENQKVFTKVKK